MKIIISPSKLQNESCRVQREFKPVLHVEKTRELHCLLNDQSTETIGKWMKIKGELLHQTVHRVRNYASQEDVHAISCYNGIVFKEIDENLYNDVQLGYLERHLRILSAFYGVVTPLTGIKPYRLDMTMKLNDVNLYKFWDKAIDDYFSDEDVIINLASKEFSKMLTSKIFKDRMINVFFKEEKHDGQLKVVTVRAKQARGLMANFMIENLIEDPNAIKQFDEMGYVFDEAVSDERNFVFVKYL